MEPVRPVRTASRWDSQSRTNLSNTNPQKRLCLKPIFSRSASVFVKDSHAQNPNAGNSIKDDTYVFPWRGTSDSRPNDSELPTQNAEPKVVATDSPSTYSKTTTHEPCFASGVPLLCEESTTASYLECMNESGFNGEITLSGNGPGESCCVVQNNDSREEPFWTEIRILRAERRCLNCYIGRCRVKEQKLEVCRKCYNSSLKRVCDCCGIEYVFHSRAQVVKQNLEHNFCISCAEERFLHKGQIPLKCWYCERVAAWNDSSLCTYCLNKQTAYGPPNDCSTCGKRCAFGGKLCRICYYQAKKKKMVENRKLKEIPPPPKDLLQKFHSLLGDPTSLVQATNTLEPPKEQSIPPSLSSGEGGIAVNPFEGKGRNEMENLVRFHQYQSKVNLEKYIKLKNQLAKLKRNYSDAKQQHRNELEKAEQNIAKILEHTQHEKDELDALKYEIKKKNELFIKYKSRTDALLRSEPNRGKEVKCLEEKIVELTNNLSEKDSQADQLSANLAAARAELLLKEDDIYELHRRTAALEAAQSSSRRGRGRGRRGRV